MKKTLKYFWKTKKKLKISFRGGLEENIKYSNINLQEIKAATTIPTVGSTARQKETLCRRSPP